MTSSSRVNTQYDAAATAILRNVADGAETSTATEAAVALGMLDAAYWQSGNKKIPHGIFEVNIHVTAIDTADGNETYTLALLLDDVSAMNDSPQVVNQFAVTATGFYKMLLDSDTLTKLMADKSGTDAYLAIRATLAGTSPSITYGAWIGKAKGI